MTDQRMVMTGEFLSTLPVRGATPNSLDLVRIRSIFLSTLPVRGATCGVAYDADECYEISIHAPREGSDDFSSGHTNELITDFYPRSP